MQEWYPNNPKELKKLINKFLSQKIENLPKKINGLIVPHAGYFYSGSVAGTAYSLIKNNQKKAIVIGPSHYTPISGIITTNKKEWQTPLGKIKIFNKCFKKSDIENEHSIKNQIPFLQFIKTPEIMPLMVGEINFDEARIYAKKLSKINAIFIFSTDLSHFKNYYDANLIDKNSIKIIENLEIEKFNDIDACGYFPLMILLELCKIKKTKPKLIQYKNSGDITGEKSSVVGYSSFYF